MKKYFFILSIATACGCGNKDKLLLDEVPVTPIVNPATKSIIKGNSLVYVRLDSGTVIHGMTPSSAFRTNNFFTDFGLNYLSEPTPTTPYSFDKNTAVYASGQVLSPVVNYSTDYGNSWTSFTPVFSPALSSVGFYSSGLVCLDYISNQDILALYAQKSYTNGNMRQLYKIDALTGQASLVAGFQDNWVPLTMQFSDAKTGWILLNNGGTWLTSTTDSGVTWTTPVLVDSRALSNLQVGSDGYLAVYEASGDACFSADNGATWKKAPATTLFSAIYVVNASALYALTNTGMIKSTDGGTTWNSTANYGSTFNNVQYLFFQDEHNGLAYGNQTLFITTDGGSNWKTLLYPYSYITQ